MPFSIGLIGLPNSGKSTLFKALTKLEVNISDRPFCTVDPNIGVASVSDERLDKLTEVLKPAKVLPMTIEFIDVAGLVKNAHKGEGLGNEFLAEIRKVQALVEVVRVFEDKNIGHVNNTIDPKRDIEIINLELAMADLSLVNKRLGEIIPKARAGDKEAIKLRPVLERLKVGLENGKLAWNLEFDEEEFNLVRKMNLLSLKPILYVLNVNDKDRSNGLKLSLPKVELSAKLELELSTLSRKEKEEMGYFKSGLDGLIKAVYKLLDLVTFFTYQNNILRALPVKREIKLIEAGRLAHFGSAEGFIKAEVAAGQDLIKAGSETRAREKGLVKAEGKDYLVQDGEVIFLKI